MRRTILLAVATLVLVSGLLVASLGTSPAAQAMSWFDSMVAMNHGHHGDHGLHRDHGNHERHRGEQHMQQRQHCADEDGRTNNRHNGSHMHRGMMGQIHGQIHNMMVGQHGDCPHVGQSTSE